MSKKVIKEPKIQLGDLCNIVGISPTTVRYYEEKKAIEVNKTNNGYRYYNFDDVLQVMNIQNLMHFGFSLADASAMAIQSEYTEIVKKMNDQHNKLEDEINLLQRKLSQLEHVQTAYGYLQNNIGKYKEIDLDSFYWMECQSQDKLLDKKKAKIIAKWNKKLAYSIPATRMKISDISKEQLAEIGYFIYEKDNNFFNGNDLSNCELYPKQHCIMTIIKGNYDLMDNYYTVLKKPLQHIHNKGYEIVNDIICILIGTNILLGNEEENHYDYFLTFFPIRY